MAKISDGVFSGFGVNQEFPFDDFQDWNIEAGVVGNQLSMKVWQDGDPEPTTPQLMATDLTPLPDGQLGVGTWNGTSNPSAFPIDAAFDDIYFTPPFSCDFNGDLSCDIDDIDLLVENIAIGPPDPATFDLTGDNLVDLDDRDAWLAAAGAWNLPSGNAYLVADFDLNGVVDGEDFIVWNANRFSNTGLWSLGDADADGMTDGLDFIEWNANKFQSADGAAAVPEPGGFMLVFLAITCLSVARRRRSVA